jgi:hypothetical protein
VSQKKVKATRQAIRSAIVGKGAKKEPPPKETRKVEASPLLKRALGNLQKEERNRNRRAEEAFNDALNELVVAEAEARGYLKHFEAKTARFELDSLSFYLPFEPKKPKDATKPAADPPKE